MLANNQFIYKGWLSFLAKLFLSHYLLDCANEAKTRDADRPIVPALAGVEGSAGEGTKSADDSIWGLDI